MIETAENIADMGMLEFFGLCSEKNVTELDAIMRILDMMHSDMQKAGLGFANDLAMKANNKEEITPEAIQEFAQRMTSIGAVMKLLSEKHLVAHYHHNKLTPACFLEN